MISDVRYALRRWKAVRGVFVTAVIVLALGISATTTVFAVVDAVLLRPLPWPDADRLVVVHAVRPDRRHNPATAANWNRGLLSWPAWDGLRATRALESVALWIPVEHTIGEDRRNVVQALHVSSNLLQTLGTSLALGRHFTVSEDEVQSDSLIVTDGGWRRRFGGRPDIIGQTVVLGYGSSGGQRKHTVVGVLRPGFSFHAARPEFLLPIGYLADTARKYGSASYRAIGRLAPGLSVETATGVASRVVAAVETKEPTSIRLVPIADEYLGETARPLWLLFGGAGLLLLVACSNVAGLLLGEGQARRHEIAVRLALGGSRGRIVRQLVVEHAILAAVGTAAGLMVSRWLTAAAVGLAPQGLPRLDVVAINVRVATFALGVGFLTPLLFGVVPTLSLLHTPPAGVLALGWRGGTSRRHLGQRAIVATAFSLALVLVVAASLLGETLYRLTSRPLGFDPSKLAVISSTFTGSRFGSRPVIRTPAERLEFMRKIVGLEAAVSASRNRQVLARLSAIPGVLAAAGASTVPFIVGAREVNVRLEGDPSGGEQRVRVHTVTEDYFELMKMPVLDGRGFGSSDQPGSHVAVVSGEFARRFTGGAVGRRFTYVFGQRPGQSTEYEVIGVVPNVRHRDFADEDRAAFYTLDRQTSGVNHFLLRTAGDPASVLPGARRAAAEVDPNIVVTATYTMEGVLAGSIAEERFRAALSLVFGGAALLLAAVGVYGLAARRVAERRREFGIRLAFGARPSDVCGLALRDVTFIVVLGIATGLPLAYGAAQLTQAFLFGVTAKEPRIFTAAAMVLGVAALLAALGPARRAGRVDPVLVLRE